ncbi:monocarboxylate transporter 13-like isoform X2 [Amphiura filiformis]|uniref:monocarboxylate transporter 13-like isoform X2 n=1 Tax=Amphiura filiformis TaxID=82378 RepID=UPI003B21D97C
MAYRRKRTQGRIVVGTSFLSYVLSGASVQIIGAYMPALSDEFNVGSAVLGWICSFGYAMMCLAGPVAGVVINKAEPRWVVMTGGLIQASGLILTYLAKTTTVLYISLGLLPGFGASLVYVSAQISVATYFTSYYSTAIGIVLSGTGVGIILLSPLIEKLIVVYGWRGAVLIHGALILNVVVMGALLPRHRVQQKIARNTDMVETKKHKINQQYHQVSPNTDEGNMKSASKQAEVLESENVANEITLRNAKTKWYLAHIQLFTASPIMVLVYLVTFFVNAAYGAAITHMYNQIVLSGYSETKGALALSLLGVGSLLGRIFHGIPIDAKIMLPSTLYMMTLIAAAVMTFVNPLANNYPGYVVSATGIGFLSGILFPLLYTIIRRNVGTWQLSTAVGLELLVDGLGIMVGGYIAGAIQQLSGNYSLSFYLVGSIYMLAVCFFLPVLLVERKAKTWINITEVGTRV